MLGAALLPGFAVDAALAERALALCPPDARADLAALGSALRGAPARRAGERACASWRCRRATSAAIAACAALDGLLSELRGARPSVADELLSRRPLEAAVLAAAAGSDARARLAAARAPPARLAIGGEDLLAAGLSGPAVGRGLRAARAALLDGEAPDRTAQLAAALAAAR